MLLKRFYFLLLITWLVLAGSLAEASSSGPLSLEAAVRLAIQRDEGLRATLEEAAALREQSVAAAQLPDPMLRLGAAALPLDSLALDDEPMTQLQLGLAQRFPAGRTRELAGRRLAVEADALDAARAERRRFVAWQLEVAWRELDYLERALALLEQDGRWLDTLVGAREAGYAAGTVGSLELIEARLERAELGERRLGLLARREAATASLDRWLGEGVAADGRQPAPEPSPQPTPSVALERLEIHPSLLRLDRAQEAASVEVNLVEQRYRPAYGVEVGYGFRVNRPDMLSAMLTFDLPLFTRDRQDRERAAAMSRTRAAAARREDARRDLSARLAEAQAREGRLAEAQALYTEALEPLAALGEDLALAAYASDAGGLAEVVSSRRRAVELTERLERLRLERGLAAAEIRYLIGDLP
ncbi:MAG: TolC family protein [Steroidobacteraceae bacterium]